MSFGWYYHHIWKLRSIELDRIYLPSLSYVNFKESKFNLSFRIFGLMMMTIEIDIKWIKHNFGFLQNYIGRGLFNILLIPNLILGLII